MSSTPKNFTARDLASILGRNQGPEQFFQQAFAIDTSPIIPKNLNVNRPMERIHIVWRGRVTIVGANYDAVAAEAPQTIIQRIRLTGTHQTYGALVPIDISGATAFALGRLTRISGASLYINGVKQPQLTVPLAENPATFGNAGTYDLEIHYEIPMGPILAIANKVSVVPFLFQNADWGDTLQLQLFFGDQTSFGTPDTNTTVTFSAYGSGTGSPLVTIFQNFEILGPLASSVASAVVLRSEQSQTAPVAANGNNVRIQLLQKQKTTNIFIKTGTILAGTNSGISVFGSLSDQVLEMTQPVVDNKPIRNNFNNFAAKEYAGWAFETVLPQGYLNFTFVDAQNPLTYYRGDLLAGGSTFELDSNVINGGAGVTANVLQEQVIGNPGTVGSSTPSTVSS
jgi:hypothetical protein